MIHDRLRDISPAERSEDALISTINEALDMARIINRREKTLETVIQLQCVLTRLTALCDYGKKDMYCLTLRGVNQIRLTELEIQNVRRDFTKSISTKSKLLAVWTMEKQS